MPARSCPFSESRGFQKGRLRQGEGSLCGLCPGKAGMVRPRQRREAPVAGGAKLLAHRGHGQPEGLRLRGQPVDELLDAGLESDAARSANLSQRGVRVGTLRGLNAPRPSEDVWYYPSATDDSGHLFRHRYGAIHRTARIVGWRNRSAGPRRWTSGPTIRRSCYRRATSLPGGRGSVQEGQASRAALRASSWMPTGRAVGHGRTGR